MCYKLYDYLSDTKCTKCYDDFNSRTTCYRNDFTRVSYIYIYVYIYRYIYICYIFLCGIHSENSFIFTRVYLCLEKSNDTTYTSMR